MAKFHEFGVKAKSFNTYEKFKTDAEKFGIKYVHEFTPFKLNNFQFITCLWFGKKFDGCNYRGIGMALSNPENDSSKIIDLDTNYDEALQYVKEWYELNKPKKKIKTNHIISELNPEKFTNFSKRNLQVIQNFLLYIGLDEKYEQTAINYIAEDHVDGEDSDSAHREIALSSELIRDFVDIDGANGQFTIFANNITELIYAVSNDESEYVRLYKLTKPQEVIEVEHRDEILDYCLSKKTPNDEVCLGDIFVHGKYVEQLN